MDSSKFNLWRASFAFCQVDQELARKEKEWIKSKLTSLGFTDEQKTTLEADILSPPDITSILPHITKPSDRAFLLDQMRVLAHIDGTLSQQERLKIEEIRNIVLSKVNLTELEAKIATDEILSYHEDEVYKVNNNDSMFESLHRYLQRAANPGEFKLPKK